MTDTNQDFTYPDDVSYGIEIRGLYDGTAIWVLKDGRVLNRFHGEGSRRERLADEHIANMNNPESGTS